MAGSLVRLVQTTVSSPTPSVTLTGIDSTYDVYQFTFNNVKVDTDDALALRVTKGGTAQDDANYDWANKYLKSSGASAESSNTGVTQKDITATIDSGHSQSNANGVCWLYSFNASEFSYVTVESIHYQYNDNEARGLVVGIVHRVASASDGILLRTNGGNNITAGTFTLYGLKK